MTYVEGDVLSPSELVIPDMGDVGGVSGAMTVSGAILYVSGAKVWFNHQAVNQIITSA